jgi:predicted helicase
VFNKFKRIVSSVTSELIPINILDYIYCVLHSNKYRENYSELLKIDFPRIPYPNDRARFWELVKLGGEIRQIHLLESAVVDNFIAQYPVKGDNLIDIKANYVGGKVWINKTQYFDNVPQVAWEFYIGGYQPAQKWLKDRKDRELSSDDINHYQKIIVALTETDRLMKEIDKIEIEEISTSKIVKMYPINDEDSISNMNMAAEPENE